MSSIAKFYKLEAEKILADGEKISLFTKHPVALGTFREARLKQYLSEHLGRDFIVSSGFVIQHDPDSNEIYDKSSPQIDSLVFDAGAAPLLRSTDFVVVEPASVAAVIEVKSDLKLNKKRKNFGNENVRFSDKTGEYIWSGTLVDALDNIIETIRVLSASGVPRERYFAGIIGYAASSIKQFEEAMRSGELLKQLGVSALDDLPDDICVFGGNWFGFSAYKMTEEPHYDFAEGSDPSWAFLLKSDSENDGTSLQIFTASFDHQISHMRKRQPHKVGGLRSGKGVINSFTHTKISVSSARQHSAVY